MRPGAPRHDDILIPKEGKRKMLALLYGTMEEVELGSGKLVTGRMAGNLCKRYMFLKGRWVDQAHTYVLRDLELEAETADGPDLLLLADAGCSMIHSNRRFLRKGRYEAFVDSMNLVLGSSGLACRLSGGRIVYPVPSDLPEGVCADAQRSLEEAYAKLRKGECASAALTAADALSALSEYGDSRRIGEMIMDLDIEDPVSARYAVDLASSAVLYILDGGGKRVKDARGSV